MLIFLAPFPPFTQRGQDGTRSSTATLDNAHTQIFGIRSTHTHKAQNHTSIMSAPVSISHLDQFMLNMEQQTGDNKCDDYNNDVEVIEEHENPLYRHPKPPSAIPFSKSSDIASFERMETTAYEGKWWSDKKEADRPMETPKPTLLGQVLDLMDFNTRSFGKNKRNSIHEVVFTFENAIQ